MIWVIDASVAIRWFIEEEADPHADEVLERIVDEPSSLAVPELFAFEVYSVLQRMHPDGLEAFRKGVMPLLQGGIFRHPVTEGLALMADRFVKRGLTEYDACYAALARNPGGMWLTFDQQAHTFLKGENISFFIYHRMPPNWTD